MQKILVKTTSDSYVFQWMTIPEEGVLASSIRETGTLAELSAVIKSAQEPSQILFLAPAKSVHVRQLAFEAAEKKHLAKTVPFTLEDEMICDAADLHCVMTKPVDNTIWVAAVQKQDLERWLQRFEDVNLTIHECIPEQILLLKEGYDWSLYYENGEFLVRCGEPKIHGIDQNNIALALELATAGYTNVPASIYLLLNEDAAKSDALLQIPEALHPYVQPEVAPLPEMVKRLKSKSSDLNLLHGQYSQGYDWLSQVKKWKALLVVCLAALFLHVGVSYAEFKKAASELSDVRSDIKQLYSQVFPKGNATGARKKIEGELKRLNGGAPSTSFLELLLKTSSTIEKKTDFKVNSIVYGSSGQLDIDILLKSQSEVESLKDDLQAAGLEVNLQNSSGQGDQVRARLKVKSQQ